MERAIWTLSIVGDRRFRLSLSFPNSNSRRHRIRFKLPREPVRGLGGPRGGSVVGAARHERGELGADGAPGVVGRQVEPSARERRPQQLLGGRWRGHSGRGLVLGRGVFACFCAKEGRERREREREREKTEREKNETIIQDESFFRFSFFFFSSTSSSSTSSTDFVFTLISFLDYTPEFFRYKLPSAVAAKRMTF